MYSSFNWEKFENWKEALDVVEGRSHDKVVVKYLKEGIPWNPSSSAPLSLTITNRPKG